MLAAHRPFIGQEGAAHEHPQGDPGHEGGGPTASTQQVSFVLPNIGRQQIESTTYFCVLEALRNTIQHAEASQARVNLSQANGSLEFQVTDDGTGFDPSSDRGVGLTAMADRLDALTGELTIHTEPGNGTTLTGTIPVPAEVLA